MEIKRMLTALSCAAVIMLTAASGYAADDVIYENGSVETFNEAQDLAGWGYELFSKCTFEADVRFKAENSGITLRNADNTKGGTSIRAVDRNGTLTMAAYGGVEGNYIYYNAVDTETTYHITLTGTYGVSNGMIDMIVDTLDEEGNVTETKNSYLILMNEMYASSNVGPEHIRIEANTVAGNIKVTELRPDSIKIVSPPQTVTAGSDTQIQVKYYRADSEIEYSVKPEYSVTGEGITISSDGVLKTAQDAPEQDFTVTVKSGDMTCSEDISLVSGDIFTINTALFSEDGAVLRAVNARKNYFFGGGAVFVITAYDENGILRDCFVKNVPVKSLPSKTDTDIILDYTLPEDFKEDTWTLEINVWGASDTRVLPDVKGDMAIRAYFEENGGAVEWLEEHRTIAGMLNGKTAVLQIGSDIAFVDGGVKPLSKASYISDDWSSYADGQLADFLK